MSLYNKKEIQADAKSLKQWFGENSRPLPWRKNKDPYRIWIAEIMLQQTTVKAVIPYYEKFMKAFPNKKALAQARLEDIYSRWAGLGYYSRARSLHKAAQELKQKRAFPKTYKELIELPGFGDYTSRAVSSQAFGERVGVVDGNVIRVLSRRFGLRLEFWKSKEKKVYQEIADEFVAKEEPNRINQALMELGSTICRPQSPSCFLCPLSRKCVAYNENRTHELPLKKKRKEFEIWHWQAELVKKNGKIAFTHNEYAPFLKKQLILPGKAIKLKKVPKKFDFQHGITHHKIFVNIKTKKTIGKTKNLTWLSAKQVKEQIPFSLIHKALEKYQPS